MYKEAIDVLQTSLESKWDYDVAKQLVNLFIECEEEDRLRDAAELTKQMVRELPDDYDTLLYKHKYSLKWEKKEKQKRLLYN